LMQDAEPWPESSRLTPRLTSRTRRPRMTMIIGRL
jgi:hypothetical protein